MKLLRDTSVLVSAAELGEIVGINLETVNNWLRHGVVTRARIGGRQLRNRLFSTEEVYKAALTNELVKLRIPPSSASDSVNTVWNQWERKESLEGKKIYALILPTKNNDWSVALCWQKLSGGPLYKSGKSLATKSLEIELPKQAFAVIPVSDVLGRVSIKLSELLG